MGELTITTFLSLDGVMQAPGGPTEDTDGGFAHGGWSFPFADGDFGKFISGVFSRADAFLLGRRTYDIFAAYWPKVTGPNEPEQSVAGPLNALPKHVASRTRTAFEWKGSAAVRDAAREVPELKRRYARELQVHGSAILAQTLIASDLIDEYRLLIYPVVLGSGKRLFGTGAVPAALALVSSRTTSKGVVVNVYRRAGKLRTGSFAPPEGGK